jgi:hypothetical protein
MLPKRCCVAMSKVFIGDDEDEGADLLAYQQFSLWLYEVVLDAIDGNDKELVDDLEGKIAKCHANIGWLRVIDPV